MTIEVDSSSPAISADGRFVAFESQARDLVAGDTNHSQDVFVRDLHTRGVARASVASSGAQANGASFDASISADGRYVAFWSYASNLVAHDTNREEDVFVHDFRSGSTVRVSVASSGAQANNHSSAPAISADGRFVAFVSGASNLVAGDTNHTHDVFVRDVRAHTTTRMDVTQHGGQSNAEADDPAISADGRYVAFSSSATNLVAGDTNGLLPDTFVRDRRRGTTTRMSVASTGAQGKFASEEPAIDAAGRRVAFVSNSPNLVRHDTNGRDDVFVRDRPSGRTTRVSLTSTGAQTRFDSFDPSMSADGRYVAFVLETSQMVPDSDVTRTDVVVRDRQARTTARVSVAADGGSPNESSSAPSVSGDGRYVAFESSASNLTVEDTNDSDDVFLRDLRTGTTTMVSRPGDGNRDRRPAPPPRPAVRGR